MLGVFATAPKTLADNTRMCGPEATAQIRRELLPPLRPCQRRSNSRSDCANRRKRLSHRGKAAS